MKKSFFKISAFVAVSLISSIALTACEDGADGAQGVAGAQGEQGEPGTSCTAKKLKDGSGYELKCDGETVGTILNGEEGKQGEPGEKGDPGANGTNCTVADTMDAVKGRAGYKLICADTLKGVVWDGVNGEAGASALELSGYDDMDELLDALKGDPGKSGTSCTVADTTDRGDSTRTGYKLLCGSTLKGVVWNGEKGQKGDPADLTLEYYNKLLLGQKGESFSWRKNDGYMVTIDGNPYGWSYWTDRAEGGSSGFNWGQVPGIVTSGTDGAFTAEIVEEVEGVGGQVLLKGAYYNTKLDLNNVNSETSVQFGCWWDDCKINTEKMLGLCLEYISEFDNTELRIAYTGEQANGYARPYYKLPKTSTKKIINVPWAAFEKSPNWGATNVDVASAIKSTVGVGIHVMSYEEASGNLLITKLGAYGACE